MALGVIGQYLARIFDEVLGRPPWIIAYALGFADRSLPHDLGWFADKRALQPGSSSGMVSVSHVAARAQEVGRAHDARVL